MFRSEHPNPQKVHDSFINLNGKWEFQYDNEMEGLEKEYFKRDHLDGSIEVPFCPESRLSGIGDTGFINAVWYRRDVDIPAEALEGNVIITFGAIDYKAKIFINGCFAAEHIGGYTPVIVNATKYLKEGQNSICVYALDNVHEGLARGKQSSRLESHDCDYTRTTGIWQTVYMEFLPKAYIKNIRVTPNAEECFADIKVFTEGNGRVKVCVSYEGRPMGEGEAETKSGVAEMRIKLSEKHLWEVGAGRLYDVTVTMGDDRFSSYFGLRDVELKGRKFLINGQSVFQRLVLDQGFYEEGIYTAPTAEDIEKDVLLSLSFGFNGARPHMKIFEPLYLYYCDKHGYLAWGEFPNWGLDMCDEASLYKVVSQWVEEMDRDYNHPSILGWCPLNETHIVNRNAEQIFVHDNSLASIYFTTKSIDPYRPCIDVSGYTHQTNNDIYDIHCYSQDANRLAELLDKIADCRGVGGDHSFDERGKSFNAGQPLFVSEYGGASWVDEKSDGWGYGNAPKSEEEFIERFCALTSAIMNNKEYFGFCYTQLYDIEQEKNGLCYYNRKPKFPPEVFKKCMSQKAAIEE